MSNSWLYELFINDAKAALNSRGPSSGGTTTPSTPSAPVDLPAKEVNFRDYDGTVLYAYTVAEAAALTKLPPLPERKGLICQGWNWSLEDIKTHGRAVEVGAMYITDDGKTRIYVELAEGKTAPRLGCYINGSVTVDWGDGSEPDIITGTIADSNDTSKLQWTPAHKYADHGKYVITLSVDGEVGIAGSSHSSYGGSYLCSGTNAAGVNSNEIYYASIYKIELGAGITVLINAAFRHLYMLRYITIPQNISKIGAYAFDGCKSLRHVTIPNDVTTISTSHICYHCCSLHSISVPFNTPSFAYNAFSGCDVLSYVTIHENITAIGNDAFNANDRLTVVRIPKAVKSIPARAFQACYGLVRMDFSNHETVPTLGDSSTAIEKNAYSLKILVPSALLEEWKAATNWSNYADKIVGV